MAFSPSAGVLQNTNNGVSVQSSQPNDFEFGNNNRGEMHKTGKCGNQSQLWILLLYISTCLFFVVKFQSYFTISHVPSNKTAPIVYKEFCVLPNYYSNNQNHRDRIVQILHMSSNLLDNRLIEQVKNWNAPMSLSIVLNHPKELSCVQSRIKSYVDSIPLLAKYLNVHILFPSKWAPNNCNLPVIDHECVTEMSSVDILKDYPANVARNVARMYSHSKYILIADFEHLFSDGFEKEVGQFAAKAFKEDEKKMLVYRIFEIEKNVTNSTAITKEELKTLMKKKKAVVFHDKVYKGAHGIEKLDEWLADNSTETGVFLKHLKYAKSKWEPQFVSLSNIPMHDTDFPFLIRDNTVLRWELCRAGYSIDVLRKHFMYHKGIKTGKSSSISKAVQAKNITRFRKALAAFKKRMADEYPKSADKCPIFRA